MLTYGELLAALYELSPTQLQQPVCVSSELLERDFTCYAVLIGIPGDLERVILSVEENADDENPSNPVALMLALPWEETAFLVGRFGTVAEAEAFLATSATLDPDYLNAGYYSIDAPEGMVNP